MTVVLDTGMTAIDKGTKADTAAMDTGPADTGVSCNSYTFPSIPSPDHVTSGTAYYADGTVLLSTSTQNVEGDRTTLYPVRRIRYEFSADLTSIAWPCGPSYITVSVMSGSSIGFYQTFMADPTKSTSYVFEVVRDGDAGSSVDPPITLTVGRSGADKCGPIKVKPGKLTLCEF